MKRKLLSMTVALLCAVGTWAQKDVTSLYITNATLSSLNGWTNKNFNTPARGNNTTGYAVEAYAGWDNLTLSEFSLTQTITVPAGHYTLVNYSFYRYGLEYNTDASKSLAYLKAGNNNVAVKTLGSITATGYANSQAEGANCFDSKMYRNTLDFTIDADNTSIEIGVYGTHDLKQSWMILGMFELINNDIPATMDAPFDVTGYLTNPGFEYRDMTGWTLEGSSMIGTHSGDQPFKVGGYFAEKWQESGALPAGSMSQTLTKLPAGYYKLTANLGGNGTYVSLNNKTASWTEDKDYTVGYVLAENEDLTVKAGKTAEGSASWIHFDNFRLQFCGDVAAALTTLCEKVSSYEGTIPTDVYTQLVSDVAAKNQTYSDVDELLAAIDAVQALYDKADLLKPAYAAWLEMEGLAEALAAVENDNSSANAVLVSAISERTDNVNAVSTTDEIATQTIELKYAMGEYVHKANPTQGNRFDLTFMVTNADLTPFASWTPADQVDGWSSDQPDGNKNVQHSQGVACVEGDAFFEYWSVAPKANNVFALYNTVEDLPEGTYTINCYALAAANGLESATTSAVYFYANETQGSLVSSETLTAASISFINEVRQDVKIGLKPLTGNTFRWMGIGYVKLYKEYTDNTTYSIVNNGTINGSVAVTVDGEAATSAKALKTVTLTYTHEEGYYVSDVSVSYTDDDGNTVSLDVANPSTDVYTFQMPAHYVIVTSTIVAEKGELASALSTATAARKAANEGTGVFQIPVSAGTALAEAIASAQAVYDRVSATPAEVTTAATTLNTAVTDYEGTTLNAPADTRYYLQVATAGHPKAGNAVVVTLGDTTDNNKTGYGFAANASPAAHAAGAYIFTQVSGNTYNISTIRPEGTVYLTYGSKNNSAAGWATQQIQGTTDASAKGEFKIVATATANVFNIVNTVYENADNYVDCQDGGALYTDTDIDKKDFTIAEATEASVTVSAKAGKFGTVIFPFTPDVSTGFDGITFYSCEEINEETNNVIMEIVATPAANTPYLIKNSNDTDFSKALTGWGTAAADQYTTGLLTGVYTAQTIAASVAATAENAGALRYVLQTQDDVQAFYKVDADFTATAYKAFLTVDVPATGGEAKALFLNFGDTATGVNSMNKGQLTARPDGTLDSSRMDNAQIYNLAGQRMSKVQKGVNIINGKKVLIK